MCSHLIQMGAAIFHTTVRLHLCHPCRSSPCTCHPHCHARQYILPCIFRQGSVPLLVFRSGRSCLCLYRSGREMSFRKPSNRKDKQKKDHEYMCLILSRGSNNIPYNGSLTFFVTVQRQSSHLSGWLPGSTTHPFAHRSIVGTGACPATQV